MVNHIQKLRLLQLIYDVQREAKEEGRHNPGKNYFGEVEKASSHGLEVLDQTLAGQMT